MSRATENDCASKNRRVFYSFRVFYAGLPIVSHSQTRAFLAPQTQEFPNRSERLTVCWTSYSCSHVHLSLPGSGSGSGSGTGTGTGTGLQVVLAPYDRVGIGGELLLFRWKAIETSESGPILTAEAAVMEFKKSMQVLMQVLWCARGDAEQCDRIPGCSVYIQSAFGHSSQRPNARYLSKHRVRSDIHPKAQTHFMFGNIDCRLRLDVHPKEQKHSIFGNINGFGCSPQSPNTLYISGQSCSSRSVYFESPERWGSK